MPTFVEKPITRTASMTDTTNSRRREYTAIGVASEAAAKTLALTNTPPVIDGCIRRSIEAEETTTDDDDATQRVFDVTVVWEGKPEDINNDPEQQPENALPASITFSTRGGTVRVKHEIPQTSPSGIFSSSADPMETAQSNRPNFDGAIGARSDGDPEGVDIVSPTLEISVEKTYNAGVFTLSMLSSIYAATGTINEEQFLGGLPGEVLFMGANGQIAIDGSGSATFTFQLQPNVGSEYGRPFSVPGFGALRAKRGWDYLWIYYEKVDDGTRAVTTPVAIYSSPVYRSSNLNDLNIFG